jgi:hypothetical protein
VAHASRTDEVVRALGDPQLGEAPYFSMLLAPGERRP